jgi:hypothetical protein
MLLAHAIDSLFVIKVHSIKELLLLLVIPELLALSSALALGAAAACPGLDPGAFALAIPGSSPAQALQTQSRSDIRDPVPWPSMRHERHWLPACAGMTSKAVDQSL